MSTKGFKLGVEVTGISQTRVSLSDQGVHLEVPADLLIVGVGVTHALDFAYDLPLAKGGGIATDEHLQAGDSVWVAGDVGGVSGMRMEHRRVAQQHGRVAALAMLGRNAFYQGVPYFWTLLRQAAWLPGPCFRVGRHVDPGRLRRRPIMVFYLKNKYVKAVLNCGIET